MKTIFYTIISSFFLFLFQTLEAQDYITHDFNDGSFYPYVVPKADQEARVTIVNNRVQTHWDQSLYNGTNSGRKAQIKQAAGDHTDDEVQFTQHIWMGFWLKIHGDYMTENTNTNAGLMQIWGHSASGSENHMCMLKFDGRNGGALVWQHRYGNVASKTNHLIYPNFPRDQFVRVVMHVKLAEPDNGLVQVWVDDELLLNESNQRIGWGEQDATGMINGTYCFGTSIGQYNYFENAGYDQSYDGDNIWFDGHMEGETRTVTYDNVSLYNGADGYDLVNPSGETSSSFTPDPDKTYYIDSPYHDLRLAADGESEEPYTTSTDTTGDDVEWQFVDNGNGYWHIQRAAGGTNPRLRTDNSATADMQPTAWSGSYTYYDFNTGAIDETYFLTLPDGPTNYKRLQVDSSGNVNMVTESHSGTWESFMITEASGSSNLVHITKSNTTDFAIDGGGGGADGQDVYLWSANQNNINQQWIEIDRGNGYYSYQKMNTNYCIDGGGGGAPNQNVYLWTCGENNQNQHWQKVAMGDGSYKLIKRNATGFTIDGGSGGVDGQSLELYDSSINSQNLQWYITPIEGISAKSTKSTNKSPVIDEVMLYPNPVTNTFTIQGAEKSKIQIFDINGKLILGKTITNKNEVIDVSNLQTGLYFTKFQNSNKIIKLIKK